MISHCGKPLIFLYVHTSNLLSGFLSRVDHISLKIRSPETTPLSLCLAKPRIPKTKFITKPPLQNQCGSELPTIKTTPKPSHFDQRVKH
jgi:hypothetical protein